MSELKMQDFVRPHLLKELTWKFTNGLDMIDSYTMKHFPYEAELKFGIKPSLEDYNVEFQQLIRDGVVKVEIIFDGVRNDDTWCGKFVIWKILDIIKN